MDNVPLPFTSPFDTLLHHWLFEALAFGYARNGDLLNTRRVTSDSQWLELTSVNPDQDTFIRRRLQILFCAHKCAVNPYKSSPNSLNRAEDIASSFYRLWPHPSHQLDMDLTAQDYLLKMQFLLHYSYAVYGKPKFDLIWSTWQDMVENLVMPQKSIVTLVAFAIARDQYPWQVKMNHAMEFIRQVKEIDVNLITLRCVKYIMDALVYTRSLDTALRGESLTWLAWAEKLTRTTLQRLEANKEDIPRVMLDYLWLSRCGAYSRLGLVDSLEVTVRERWTGHQLSPDLAKTKQWQDLLRRSSMFRDIITRMTDINVSANP